jgi:hypothetical protein
MYKTTLILVSILSLAACIAVPVLYFLGRMSIADYRVLLLCASAGWFGSAAALAFRQK